MAKKGKLLLALDAHKGRDYDAEKRKKQMKSAEKQKQQKRRARQEEDGELSGQENENEREHSHAPKSKRPADNVTSFPDNEQEDDDDDEEGNDAMNGVVITDQSKNLPQPKEASPSPSEPSDPEDVPLSDLSDLEDTIPYQKQSINNGPALRSSTKSITITQPHVKFSIHNSLVSSLPSASTAIPDAHDDLTREMEFYRIAKEGVLEGRSLLLAEGIAFSRPPDYFAEMVKTDEHMGRIRQKMRDDAAGKKASSEAKAQRQARKFGKQVQQAKEQERAKEKRTTLDKIKDLKRSMFLPIASSVFPAPPSSQPARKIQTNSFSTLTERKGLDTGLVNESDSLFQSIAVEAPSSKDKSGRDRTGAGDGRDPPSRHKRQKKDAKFGFGGRKRFGKSGDASSTADLSGFSEGRMKGRAFAVGGRGGGRGGRGGGSGARGGVRKRGGGSGITRGKQRLGKSRRAAGN